MTVKVFLLEVSSTITVVADDDDDDDDDDANTGVFLVPIIVVDGYRDDVRRQRLQLELVVVISSSFALVVVVVVVTLCVEEVKFAMSLLLQIQTGSEIGCRTQRMYCIRC